MYLQIHFSQLMEMILIFNFGDNENLLQFASEVLHPFFVFWSLQKIQKLEDYTKDKKRDLREEIFLVYISWLSMARIKYFALP